MDINVLFAPLVGFVDAHPAFVAWMLAWLGALCAGQTCKQLLPPSWSVTACKRAVQMIATVAGTVTAYLLWPKETPDQIKHAPIFAIICGMSSPTAYTFIKAVIETRWPALAFRLSWGRVQERAHECTADPCLDPDCTKRHEIGDLK